jgi:hypothetical protein
MRHALQLIAAALLVLVVAAPVAAVEPGGAARETLSGILEAAQVDRPGGGDAFVYTLRDGRTITPLTFDRGHPRELAGARIEVTGQRTGQGLRVRDAKPGADVRVRREAKVEALGAWEGDASGGSSSPRTTAVAGATEAAPVAKSVAVVLLNFTDLGSTPFSKAQVRDALTDGTASVKAFYEEESKGRLSVSGSVFGWYTINAATTGCNWSSWHTLAWNAANAQGANLESFTNVMFVFPNTSQCQWAGLGYVPRKYTNINGTMSVQVLTHELGHNFGLSHSNFANCLVNGTRVMVAAPASCTPQTYADPFSTMGNNALRHNHGSHLGELGWLSGAEKAIATPGTTYTITPYFGGTGLKLVRVPRGDGSFFDLDYRATFGTFDTFAAGSPVVTGLSVRIGVGTASPTTSPKATLLLDSTPGTSSLSDAPLAVGRTMTDPVSKLSISVVSASASGIVVKVKEPNDPTTPGNLQATAQGGNVTLTWSPSTDDTAVTGYEVRRNDTLLATTASNASTWTDSGASGGSTYTYAVRAIDGSGNDSADATTTVTVQGGGQQPVPTPTPAPTASPAPTPSPDPTDEPDPTDPPPNDIQAPTAPGGLSGEPTTTTVSLAWEPASDDTGVVGYRVTRNGNLVASPGDVTWKDTARRPDTTYTYTVAALDGVGNVSEEATLTVVTLPDTAAPTRPTDFHKVARRGARVTFDWAPATDNVGIRRYAIYRVGRSSPVETTTVSRIRIRTVRDARYYVRAIDAAGNRSEATRTIRGRR